MRVCGRGFLFLRLLSKVFYHSKTTTLYTQECVFDVESLDTLIQTPIAGIAAMCSRAMARMKEHHATLARMMQQAAA